MARPAALHSCPPDALAALGPVLCLHDARDRHPLSGWRRAVQVHAHVSLDSEGPSEALCFRSADGECCWQLHRLPDSDFLAWERLLDCVPVEACQADTHPGPRWRVVRLSAWPRWRPCALRLHAVPGLPAEQALAAADVDLSRLGREAADRIARRLGGLIGFGGGLAPA